METIRLHFIDFWPEWSLEDFITPIISKKYNIILDSKNPDILIHSIFNRAQGAEKYNCKKILVLGENYRPSQFKTNYSISFDPHSETNFRLPLWQMYILLKPHYKEKLYNKVQHKEFDRFCSFTVSNGANFIRNGMFQELNKYKKVYSYGRFLTTSRELQELSVGKYWRDAKDEFFNRVKHKFSIVFENSSYPYYCTEKLMDCLLAGTIPIYWGDPKFKLDFNEKSIINANKLGIEKTIETVKELDNNEELFAEYYIQPVFTEEQRLKLEDNLNNFENWLIKIIK